MAFTSKQNPSSRLIGSPTNPINSTTLRCWWGHLGSTFISLLPLPLNGSFSPTYLERVSKFQTLSFKIIHIWSQHKDINCTVHATDFMEIYQSNIKFKLGNKSNIKQIETNVSNNRFGINFVCVLIFYFDTVKEQPRKWPSGSIPPSMSSDTISFLLSETGNNMNFMESLSRPLLKFGMSWQ